MKTKETIHKGSDNVFADIGVTHPERARARAQVMFLVWLMAGLAIFQWITFLNY